MRILHLTQYYPPEAGAVQARAEQLDRHLAAQGHRVTVVTEVPNHPSGIIRPEYRGKLWTLSHEDGVEVLRLWVQTSAEKNLRTRLAFYLSYMVGAILAGLALPRRYDVIFANSPPLPVAAAGAVLGLLRRTTFVMEVQDLWPESAVAMGELGNPRAVGIARRMENFCYRRAQKVVAVSRGILHDLDRRLPPGRTVLCSNGSNTEIFHPAPEAGANLRQRLGIEDKFLVVYGGILGLAQGLEVVLQAAKLLVDQPAFHFLVVGDGPRQEALQKLHRELALANLTFVPGQPLAQMAAFFSAADVCLVPLRKLDVFKGVLPTKMFDSWACRTPTLINVDGEAREVLESVGAGVFVEPENPQVLADALRRLRSAPEQLERMGSAGYEAVHERYSLQASSRQLEGILRAAAG
jgi:glycosyltransferase involved in cell wall biosynthesis